MFRFQKSNNSPAIHSHEETLAFEYLHMAVSLGCPLMSTFHGLPPQGVTQLSKSKRKLLYTHASTILANTIFSKKQLLSLGAPNEKIQILPQGLPLTDFPYNPAPHPAPSGPIKLLTVGRFQRDKGQEYALLATKRLLQLGHNIEYNMVGVGDTGRRRLEGLSKKIGIESAVHFHQNICHEGLKNLYNTCHIFILPSLRSKSQSHTETQGVVIQEAQASGCLVIATQTGGIPECVVNEVNATLINDRSSKEIANAVCTLLNNDELWKNMQINGRHHVKQKFCSFDIGKKMASIIKSLKTN